MTDQEGWGQKAAMLGPCLCCHACRPYDWMRLVDDCEHVIGRDAPFSREGGLQIVERVTQISLRREQDGLESLRRVLLDALGVDHLLDALEHVLVVESREAQDGAARLDRLDNFA